MGNPDTDRAEAELRSRLVFLRGNAGLSLKQIEDRASVGHRMVSHAFNAGTNGKPNPLPSWDLISAIARVIIKALAPTDAPDDELDNLYSLWLKAKGLPSSGTRRERAERDAATRKFLLDQGEVLRSEAYRLPVPGSQVEPPIKPRVTAVTGGIVGQDTAETDRNGAVLLSEAINSHRLLVVEGDPGSGKSTAVRRITTHLSSTLLAENHSDAFPDIPLIPVYLPARMISGSGTLTNLFLSCLQRMLGVATTPLRPDFLDAPALGGRWLLILDGLDEILDEATREAIAMALAGLTESQPESVKVIITTRPTDHRIIQLLQRAGFSHFRLQSPTLQEVRSLARNLLPEESQVKLFLREIERPENSWLAGSPLFITIAAGLFTAGSFKLRLQETRVSLLSSFVQMCFAGRPGNDGVQHDLNMIAQRSGATPRAAAWLVDNRPTLLLVSADAALRHVDPLDAAYDFARSQLPASSVTLVRDLKKLVASILTSTGLVSEYAGTLDWSHRVLAEFLVGRHLAEQLPDNWPSPAFEEDPFIETALQSTNSDVAIMAIAIYTANRRFALDRFLRGLLDRSDTDDRAPHRHGHPVLKIGRNSSQPDYHALLAGRLVNFGCEVMPDTYDRIVERLCLRAGSARNSDLFVDQIIRMPYHSGVSDHLSQLFTAPDIPFGVALSVTARVVASTQSTAEAMDMVFARLNEAANAERASILPILYGGEEHGYQDTRIIASYALALAGSEAFEKSRELIESVELQDLSTGGLIIAADAYRLMGKPDLSVKVLAHCRSENATMCGLMLDRYVAVERSDLAVEAISGLLSTFEIPETVRLMLPLVSYIPREDALACAHTLIERLIAEQDQINEDWDRRTFRISEPMETEASRQLVACFEFLLEIDGVRSVHTILSALLEPRPRDIELGKLWNIVHSGGIPSSWLNIGRRLWEIRETDAALSCLWYLCEPGRGGEYLALKSLEILTSLGDHRARERTVRLLRDDATPDATRLSLVKTHLQDDLASEAHKALSKLVDRAGASEIVEVGRMVWHTSPALAGRAVGRIEDSLREGKIIDPEDFSDAVQMIKSFNSEERSQAYFQKCLADSQLFTGVRWAILQFLSSEGGLTSSMKPSVCSILDALQNPELFTRGVGQFGQFLGGDATCKLIIRRILRGADNRRTLVIDSSYLPKLFDMVTGKWPADVASRTAVKKICLCDPIVTHEFYEECMERNERAEDITALMVGSGSLVRDFARDPWQEEEYEEGILHSTPDCYELDLTKYASLLAHLGDRRTAYEVLARWKADSRLTADLRQRASHLLISLGN